MSVFDPKIGSALGPLEDKILMDDRPGSGEGWTRVGDNLNKLTRPDGSAVYFDDFGNIVE